jgi:imidazolonepropionase-like amidohydrolase
VGDRITAVEAFNGHAPDHARMIDGPGNVIPGLADMHV